MEKGFDVERELKGKFKGGTLENWHLTEVGEGQHIIWGNVMDDDRFHHGERIHTSLITTLHRDENIVETLNTYYTLGKEAEPPKPLTEEEKAEREKAFEILARAII